MDSPDDNCSRMDVSHLTSILREVNKVDDSGYVTVTPSSAECSSMLSDLSRNISAVTPFLPYNTSTESPHSHGEMMECSLQVRKSRESKYRPKLLFAESSSVDLCLSPVDINTEKTSLAQDLNAKDESTTRRGLKRQKAVDLDFETTENEIRMSKSEDDHCVIKLQQLVVEDASKGANFLSVETPASSRDLNQRCTTSDPREYSKCMRSLNQCTSKNCQYRSLDLYTPHAQCNAQDVKYNCTPVKTYKKFRRSSPEESMMDRTSKTPEKQVTARSECHSSEHKFAKKLNFESQKLGSPEKYEILYRELKPVTPPKKIKPLKVGSPKCRKRLSVDSENKKFSYVIGTSMGISHIDFLKMLGQVQSIIPPLTNILKHLSGMDLIKCCLVSKSWYKICTNEKRSNKERLKTVKRLRSIKENAMNSVGGKTKGKTLVLSRDCLSDLQNQHNIMAKTSKQARSPPVSPGRRKHNLFVKAASVDSTSVLRSCPKCQRPARVRGQWAECEGQSCGYVFCIECSATRVLGSVHNHSGLEAPSPSKPRYSSQHRVGSKESKKFLKRL